MTKTTAHLVGNSLLLLLLPSDYLVNYPCAFDYNLDKSLCQPFFNLPFVDVFYL